MTGNGADGRKTVLKAHTTAEGAIGSGSAQYYGVDGVEAGRIDLSGNATGVFLKEEKSVITAGISTIKDSARGVKERVKCTPQP